jgi:hypothetical protein
MQSRPNHKQYGVFVADAPIIDRRNRQAEESHLGYAFRVLLDDRELRDAFSDFMVPAENAGIDGEGEENWRQGRWNS